MMKIVFLFLIVFIGFVANAQLPITSIQKIDQQMQLQPKYIVILLSTDWCTYCHVQKNKVNARVAVSNNPTFYYVEIDAEKNQEILFNKQIYTFDSKSKTHSLAQALQNYPKQMIYPYWIVLNEKYQIIYRYPGFLKPKQVESLLLNLNTKRP